MIGDFDGNALLIGMGIGLVFGAVITERFVAWIRCSECCWNSEDRK